MRPWLIVSIVLVFAIGVCFGVAGGILFGAHHYGSKIASHAQLYEEARLAQDGLESFEAYLKEPAIVGIYALQRHVDLLRRMERRAGTNVVILHGSDLAWMQVKAHVRLSKLHAKAGEVEQSNKEMSFAMMHLPGVVWESAPRTEAGLRTYIDSADKEARW